MAQLPVGRPLAEAHLADEAGLGPVHPACRRPRRVAAIERRPVALQAGQRRVEGVQGPLAEAGADLARVHELPVAVVVAEQQRAEAGPRPLWVGEAADDELLAALALELQPVLGPSGSVRRVGALGDDPLPAVGAGLPVVRLAVGVPVDGEAQRVIEGQQVAQDLLALPQRHRAHVAVTGPEHVEDVVEDGVLVDQGLPGMAHAEALLQAGEPGLAVLERDDLPVHDEVVRLLGRQRPGDLRVRAGVLFLVARHEPDLRAGPEREASLAVELALVDPRRVGEPLLGKRGELRIEPGRLIRSYLGDPRGGWVRAVRHFSSATCSMSFPDFTDSGSSRSGSLPSSANLSAFLTSSHTGPRLSRRPGILVSEYPPRSFVPCRSKLTCPRSTASATETVWPAESLVRLSYMPVSHTMTAPAPYSPGGISPSTFS